jgi:predicted lipid-binding transport protein (Tim44 family)
MDNSSNHICGSVDVEFMANAKMQLEGLIDPYQNDDYKCILQLINAYLRKNCTHNIISDMIDISETRSKTIYYCENCSLTFDGLSAPR